MTTMTAPTLVRRICDNCLEPFSYERRPGRPPTTCGPECRRAWKTATRRDQRRGDLVNVRNSSTVRATAGRARARHADVTRLSDWIPLADEVGVTLDGRPAHPLDTEFVLDRPAPRPETVTLTVGDVTFVATDLETYAKGHKGDADPARDATDGGGYTGRHHHIRTAGTSQPWHDDHTEFARVTRRRLECHLLDVERLLVTIARDRRARIRLGEPQPISLDVEVGLIRLAYSMRVELASMSPKR